jgi:hypothetical protein
MLAQAASPVYLANPRSDKDDHVRELWARLYPRRGGEREAAFAAKR